MEIVSKSEAQERAKALRTIPDSVIAEINNEIAKGYASNSAYMTFSRPSGMSTITWKALADAITSKGYVVKAEACQREGEWLRILF
jgi:hypothetical protein